MIIEPPAVPTNWWLRLGTAGTGLTLVVLGASMLLRLATDWAADGQAQSVLPPVVEHATRLAHRLAASGVSLVALCAVLLAWMQRRTNRRMVSTTACLVAATVVLAGIGPLTPGYRVAAITVLNVGVGMVLLLAFWWMRESSARMPYRPWMLPRVARLALAALILHTATGAAASAYRTQGLSWPAWVHLACGENGWGELGAVYNHVQTTLEQTNKVLRGIALHVAGFLIRALELLFSYVAIIALKLLLGAQLNTIIGKLAFTALTMLAGAIFTLVYR